MTIGDFVIIRSWSPANNFEGDIFRKQRAIGQINFITAIDHTREHCYEVVIVCSTNNHRYGSWWKPQELELVMYQP